MDQTSITRYSFSRNRIYLPEMKGELNALHRRLSILLEKRGLAADIDRAIEILGRVD